MIKNEELNNQKSCLNQAHSDEPIFTLRANDELAPDVVRVWAGRYLKKHRDAGQTAYHGQ